MSGVPPDAVARDYLSTLASTSVKVQTHLSVAALFDLVISILGFWARETDTWISGNDSFTNMSDRPIIAVDTHMYIEVSVIVWWFSRSFCLLHYYSFICLSVRGSDCWNGTEKKEN